MPRQFGPMMRNSAGRATSSIAWRRCAPTALPPSPKPAVMTTAPAQPRSASWPISPGTVSGGVAIMARSGFSGSDATSGQARRPSISLSRGLIGIRVPANPAARMLESTTWPTAPGRAEAPMTATARGLNRRSRLRIVMERRGGARACRNLGRSFLGPSFGGVAHSVRAGRFVPIGHDGEVGEARSLGNHCPTGRASSPHRHGPRRQAMHDFAEINAARRGLRA